MQTLSVDTNGQTILHVSEWHWFIISKTNHTFTGTAEEIYKNETCSTDVVTAEYYTHVFVPLNGHCRVLHSCVCSTDVVTAGYYTHVFVPLISKTNHTCVCSTDVVTAEEIL